MLPQTVQSYHVCWDYDKNQDKHKHLESYKPFQASSSEERLDIIWPHHFDTFLLCKIKKA